MKFNPNQRYTRWSIRRLSVGVASVVVASGFFVLVGQPSSVRADVVNPTPGQVLPEETSGTKEGDLSEKPGDTVLTQAKPEGVTGNTNSLPTPTERTEVSEETNSSSLDTLFEKDEEAQKNPELTDVLKETVDTADVDGTQASPAETTPEQVKGGVKENTKDSIDVPAAYLEKAKGEGPFTAGVNHVIPYELFAGDGMLTRLLLKASDKAPWSDNGDAKNPALSPLGENVKTKGQYFYQLALDGNVAGKEKQALIDQFRANGTQTYSATVNVYGNKDGKPDLDNIVATKKVTIKINVKETSDTANGSLSPSNSGSGVTPMNHNHATGTTDSMPADTMTSSTNTMAGENMAASANKMSDTMMSEDKAMLPNTGETQTSMASIGFLGLALAGLLGGLGLKNKKEEN
ncbi:TPA: PavB family fibronectin-binding SSURE repeat adhesin [Streptococcus pneumoniae]|uniref:PavB family fibronectin-binding SSURE repeat adhesin n=1 Tax=Streptococcus pneumoniae TaxID=1313 RepID=UPI000254BE10|nr:PavB family fibronectin-binding SSURE repeat adhesin [Streptococcus pneumoniae]EHZ18202.1 LPXTG-motif cell wall anchor domain protein [Streptococcus pneumoniae GA13430]EIC48538.1 LPXTG-motif cell wall anchor domain protein [Streptococcus pneumoniae SV36]MDG9665960.1 PavB family fibronectin-binding SSURE repeat adhesin [Streptococcus pneumoniae]MDS5263780.1 PavB family fibronectin-binding SSURE repeat adhesin [Streptococcus pneumoniae]SNJ40151.1 cell wall surface anchor family protein [Strep